MTEEELPIIDDGEKCPKCGSQLSPVWENNGFEEPEGPRKDEITGWKCPNCGYKL